jgi:large subunit ribosomal protein L4
MLSKLSFDSIKTLLVLPENDKNIFLASRNIQNTQVLTVDNLNTYDVLHADRILFVEGSVEKLDNLLK